MAAADTPVAADQALNGAAGATWSIWSTTAHLIVTDRELLNRARGIADDWLSAISDACDRFRADSELSAITDASAGVQVSPLLRELVFTALLAARRTSGTVDPTVGRAMAALGYDRDLRLVMNDGRPVRAVMTSVPGWRRVRLDGPMLTMPAGVQLDLGATAKAFAADRIAADVSTRLATGVLVNLGGDIATAGPGPEAGWQVTVQDVPGDPAGQVSLQPGHALATSSTQRRRWIADGHLRHHILDPSTGLPAEAVWRTVSVSASTAVTANTYATAAVVLGRAAIAELSAVGLPARLVWASGAVTVLNGWPKDTVPEDDYDE